MRNYDIEFCWHRELSWRARGIIFALVLVWAGVGSAQSQGSPLIIGQARAPAPVVLAPLPPTTGQLNSAGWNTGYSVVTSTSEQSNPLGYALGGSRTITQTTTRVVPNDALGQPIRGGVFGRGERNTAGWNTGYSVVTQSYERADPLGYALGGSRTAQETTTRVVPNDAWGDPIEPILPLWP